MITDEMIEKGLESISSEIINLKDPEVSMEETNGNISVKMNEKKVIELLRPLDVVETRNYYVDFSNIIAIFSSSVFAHTETYSSGNYTLGLMTKDGFDKHPFNDLLFNKGEIVGIFRPKQEIDKKKKSIFKNKLNKFLKKYINYDYSSFMAILFADKNREDDEKITTDMDYMKDAYVCSTLITSLYRSVGIDIVDNKYTYSVTPADIERSSKLDLIGVLFEKKFYKIIDMESLRAFDRTLRRGINNKTMLTKVSNNIEQISSIVKTTIVKNYNKIKQMVK